MPAFQTTRADEATLQGQNFYRINQPVQENGDIFEIDVGVKAIIVGPESDFSEYSIFYLDPTGKIVNSFSVSTDQPFVGQLDARNDTIYPRTSVVARILVIPKNIFAIAPLGPFELNNVLFRPNIDLIVYTMNPPQIPDKRPVRVFRTALDLSVETKIRVLCPTYGRRNWNADFVYTKDGGADPDWTAKAFGLRYLFPISDIKTESAFVLQQLDTDGPTTMSSPGQSIGMSWSSEKESAMPDSAGFWDFVIFELTTTLNLDPSAQPNGQSHFLLQAYD